MHIIREKLLNAISGGESVNRRLIIAIGLGVAAVMAIMVSLNSAKAISAVPGDMKPAVAVQLPDCYVHVVGEVAKPGIYSLPASSRVFDAVFAAGGFTNKADEGSINLARSVSDGEQILVLGKGDSPTAPSEPGSARPISLNRGTPAQLETLPGVGPTLAARIIDWRLANGGFKKMEDLKQVTGIGSKLFLQIKAKATL